MRDEIAPEVVLADIVPGPGADEELSTLTISLPKSFANCSIGGVLPVPINSDACS